MADRLTEALAGALGSQVVNSRGLAGGDINRALRVELADGRALFVKTHGKPPAGMFGAEAASLGWLSEAGAVRIPEVIAVSDGDPAFLVLELIEPGRPGAEYAEVLGRQLAALHGTHVAGFGWPTDNFIAVLPQANQARDGWAQFYVEQRLLPQLRLARDGGAASEAMTRGMERLCGRMPELVGPAEPPARLHGDLWGGNAMADKRGEPVLIDPAVYGGHREMDLAMMRLFGGFQERTFGAYHEAYPLAAGHRERVGLYQLYPLMVHVNLFGGGYTRQVTDILDRY